MPPLCSEALPSTDKAAKLAVTISVFGRFHAFNLAKGLQDQGALHRLITTYPKGIATRWGVEPGRISSISPLEVLNRLWQKFPTKWRQAWNAQAWFCRRFGHSAAKRLPTDTNVFVGWSSFSLESLRRARALGIKTVLERGSTHIAFQTNILEEEYARWGLAFNDTHPEVQAREAQEYAEADRIAVPSLFVKRTFTERGFSPGKILHLPYGVSLNEFFPTPKQDGVFRIIHCGHISLRKGIPYLVRAFHELNLPKAELWLVGAVAPEILPIIKPWLNDKVIFKGTYPQARLRELYTQASIFCLASIEEGLAIVILQAMACGLPVIYTPNSGGGDVIDDGVEGCCIPPRDVEALKETILQLYHDPERRAEMGRQARKRVTSTQSWEQYAANAAAAYRRLLVDSSPGEMMAER